MKKQFIPSLLMLLVLLFAIVGAFSRIMISLNHNEHMYITASVFVSRGQTLYKDFAYLQMPYLPLLYGVLYRLLGITSYYLLIGKGISFFFLVVSAFVLFLVTRSVMDDTALSLSIVVLFLLNNTIIYSAKEASNYIMPVAFSLLGFYVFNASVNHSVIKPLGITLAGFFLALAIGVKLTYATVVIPFLSVNLIYFLRRDYKATVLKRNVVHVFFLFCIGMVIGFLPVLFYLLPDPESFFFNNLGYHAVNTQWRQDTGYTVFMSLSSKISYACEIFFLFADNLILVVSVLSGLARFVGCFQVIRQMSSKAFLAVLLFLIAVPTAIAPTPSFLQYYVMPVSFLFLLLVYASAPNPCLCQKSRLYTEN